VDGITGTEDQERGDRLTLFQNEWLSLCVVVKPEAGVNGYVYSHETRCAGRIVAVLPYADTPAGRRYLVKSEMTPCWSFDQVLSAVTGGYEGGDIEDDAVREMLEETGYSISRDELIPLGWSYASKSADTVYSLFSVDLTGREAGEAIGDGSRVESESAAVWLSAEELLTIADPQVSVMYVRLDHRAAYRAGREDVARDLERVARSTRESLVCTPPEYAGEAAYHRTRAVAFERAAVIARGDGVQPTEEQRAHE
jgi:8-oxo-dGTP pyrophosphatase MutT (NUDIX family)